MFPNKLNTESKILLMSQSFKNTIRINLTEEIKVQLKII